MDRVAPLYKLLRTLLVLIGVFAVVFSLLLELANIGAPGFGISQWALCCFGIVLLLFVFLSDEWTVRIAVFSGSVLVSLLLAEVVLQTAMPSIALPSITFHKDYLYTLRPGSRAVKVNGEHDGGESVVFEVNSDGFRGPELRTVPGAHRVMVYGDSFIHGHYTALEQSYVKQLEGALVESTGRDIEVINAGVDGYGPDQSFLRMLDDIPEFNPDIVVLGLYLGNDYGDLIRNKLFVLDSEDRLKRNSTVDLSKYRSTFGRSQGQLVLMRLLRNAYLFIFRKYLFPEELPESRMETIHFGDALNQRVAEYRSFIVEGDQAPAPDAQDSHDADIGVLPAPESVQLKIRLMHALLKRIAEFLKEQKVQFVVVLIPSAVDLGGTQAHPITGIDEHPGYDPRRSTDLIMDVCKAEQLACLNLYPFFESISNDDLYLVHDMHWSPAGQQLAAAQTAAFLNQFVFD